MIQFGTVYGRFFVEQDLGIKQDDAIDTCTLSELLETFEFWKQFVEQVSFKTKQLFTMFETSDVHPDIIQNMKVFDRVIVPFGYLRDILIGHGINAVSVDYHTSSLIRGNLKVIPKKFDPDRIIFLYIGTNDVRKNVVSLTRVFSRIPHVTLIVKTNTSMGLIQSDNIKIITDKLSQEQLSKLYNLCDYVVSFTHGEGVGLPMLEASYFGKPVVCHDQGVFRDVKKFIKTPWYVLPSREVSIDYSDVPEFLKKVFYKSWWSVDEDEAFHFITNLVDERLLDVNICLPT
jgi:glycosyltransferase involved in cell wall biosynthesis